MPTPTSTYKGDSPGKKLSRFRTWVLMLQAARVLRVPYEGALVLAGEGGDLPVLDALRVPLPSVTAVDLDPDWAHFARDAYGCQALVGDVADMSKHARFSLAHIDFCGKMTAKRIKTLTDVCWNINAVPSIIAVTMLKGRETKTGTFTRKELLGDIPRRLRRNAQLEARKQGNHVGEYVLSSPKVSPLELLKIAKEQFRGHVPFRPELAGNGRSPYEKNGDLSPIGTAMVRACALQSAVEWVGSLRGDWIGDGPNLTTIGVVGYHSKTKKKHGTPFMTAVYAVHPPSFREGVQRVLIENPGNFMFDSLDAKTAMAQLAPTGAELAKAWPAERVGKLLDVPTKTVIAWKAHASRGTYKTPPLFKMAYGTDLNKPSIQVELPPIATGFPVGSHSRDNVVTLS